MPIRLLHKPSGQARVIIDGKHIYLGEYGSPESHEKYARLIAEFSKPAEAKVDAGKGKSELSVNEMLVRYCEFAQSYYVKDGEPTQELASMAEALLPLRQLFGHTRAAEFGPRALQTVRQHLIDNDICRGVITHFPHISPPLSRNFHAVSIRY